MFLRGTWGRVFSVDLAHVEEHREIQPLLYSTSLLSLEPDYLKELRCFPVELNQIKGLTANLGGQIVFSHVIQAIIPPL